MTIIIVILAIFLINTFFGYWRANTRPLTTQWIMAIHIPIPIAIGLRVGLLGWNWLMLPVFIITYAAGQYSGGLIRVLLKKRANLLTSFLIMDLFKVITNKQKNKVLAP